MSAPKKQRMSKFISTDFDNSSQSGLASQQQSESQPQLKPMGTFSMKNLQKAIMTPKDHHAADVPKMMAAAVAMEEAKQEQSAYSL